MRRARIFRFGAIVTCFDQRRLRAFCVPQDHNYCSHLNPDRRKNCRRMVSSWIRQGHNNPWNRRTRLLEYQYPSLNAPRRLKEFGYALASLDDIATMKLSAVAQQRGNPVNLELPLSFSGGRMIVNSAPASLPACLRRTSRQAGQPAMRSGGRSAGRAKFQPLASKRSWETLAAALKGSSSGLRMHGS